MQQRQITDSTLDGYLRCPRKGWLRSQSYPADPTSEYPVFLQTSAKEYQSAAKKILMNTVVPEKILQSPKSSQCLKQGYSLILDACFEAYGYVAPSLTLERVPGPSELGDFNYQPVIYEPSDRITEHPKSLLAFHGFIVGALQGFTPELGSIISGPGFRRSRVRLKPHLDRLQRALKDLREMTLSEVEPPILLNSHCDVCDFSALCKKDALESDHLSLLKGMSEKQISRLNSKGIFTVHQLSFTFRSRRRPKRAKPAPPPHSYALQALAHRESKLYVHGSVAIPDSPTVVYFDFEGLPDPRSCYLFGAIVCRGESAEYLSFWADRQADEVAACESFLRSLCLTEDLLLFHFGDYEMKALRRLRSQVRSELVDHVNKIEDCATNVLHLLYHHFYFPVLHNRLKTVAETIGFQWSEPDADGLKSIMWRYAWEQQRDPATKQRLLQYNQDDCNALRHLTEFLRASLDSIRHRRGDVQAPLAVESTEGLRSTIGRSHLFGRFKSPIADLNEINKCAYFDYQQDRVFARAGKRKSGSQVPPRRKRRRPKANKTLEIQAARCPNCNSRKILERHPIKRRVVDLRFGSSSIKKWIVDYRSFRYLCKQCDAAFVPHEVPDNKTKYGHGLASWCVYSHLVGGQNLLRIRQVLRDAFDLDVPHIAVWRFKQTIRNLVEPFRLETWQQLLHGSVLYVDETEVKLRGMKGYVWVFASPDRVCYTYRESREASFLPDFLSDFRGVVVSDFFTGYDSLPFPQQKCLIHLIRDMNADIRASPFDEELREVVQLFATWLRDVIRAIDQFGLVSRRLRRYQEAGSAMLERIGGQEFSSDAAKKYQNRFAKYGDRLMTFAEHDGVSWNNNVAEHAIKAFARFRRFADGRFTEMSVRDLLGIMSVIQTLHLQHRDVLSYLRGLGPTTGNTASVESEGIGFGSRPEEKTIVKRVAGMRRRDQEGNRMTYEQIADTLNNEGVPTRRGGRWWGTTVRNVLRRNRGRRKK